MARKECAFPFFHPVLLCRQKRHLPERTLPGTGAFGKVLQQAGRCLNAWAGPEGRGLRHRARDARAGQTLRLQCFAA